MGTLRSKLLSQSEQVMQNFKSSQEGDFTCGGNIKQPQSLSTNFCTKTCFDTRGVESGLYQSEEVSLAKISSYSVKYAVLS